MIKQLFKYFIIYSIVFLLGFNIHEFILGKLSLTLSFSLISIYVFHAGFSLLICAAIKLMSTKEKLFPQLGFIYLGTLMLKIVTFSIVFNSIVFGDKVLTKKESLSMLIPIAIFLILEVYFIAKIINKKHSI